MAIRLMAGRRALDAEIQVRILARQHGSIANKEIVMPMRLTHDHREGFDKQCSRCLLDIQEIADLFSEVVTLTKQIYEQRHGHNEQEPQ